MISSNQWWWPWRLGTHDKTLQRPHDWDHWHLRMNSQEDTILINILLDLRRKLQYIFRYLKAPRSSRPNESRTKLIGDSYKQVWPKYWRLCTLKNFWTARSAKSKTGITPSFGLRLKQMTTHWKGNFINISIDLYFGICSVEYTWEIPRRRGRSNAMRTRQRRWQWQQWRGAWCDTLGVCTVELYLFCASCA